MPCIARRNAIAAEGDCVAPKWTRSWRISGRSGLDHRSIGIEYVLYRIISTFAIGIQKFAMGGIWVHWKGEGRSIRYQANSHAWRYISISASGSADVAGLGSSSLIFLYCLCLKSLAVALVLLGQSITHFLPAYALLVPCL